MEHKNLKSTVEGVRKCPVLLHRRSRRNFDADEARVTNLVEYGPTASGLRFDVGFEGQLSGGLIKEKCRVSTIS